MKWNEIKWSNEVMKFKKGKKGKKYIPFSQASNSEYITHLSSFLATVMQCISLLKELQIISVTKMF